METTLKSEAHGNEAMLDYVKRIPASQREIPAGHVLVHNHVRPPHRSTRSGIRGFRYWLQVLTDDLASCDCGWAPEVPEHYRVARGGES